MPLTGLIEPKTLSIMRSLKEGKLFHLNSLAKKAKVPISSTARIVKRLVKNHLVEELKVGKLSVYKIADNKKTKRIEELL